MWKWLARFLELEDDSPTSSGRRKANQPAPLWDEDEAAECRAEIDRIVAEFLRKCRTRNRLGRVRLEGRRSCEMGFAGMFERTALFARGDGWIYEESGSATFAVENTGRWIFAGYYGVRLKDGSDKIETWVVNSTRWQVIDQLEFSFFRDTGSASPTHALECARRAIAQWQQPRKRPSGR